MKQELIKEIEQSMLMYLDNAQLEILHQTLVRCIDSVEVLAKNENKKEIYKFSNTELINRFIAAKKIEGCSDKTISYYKSTLNRMIDKLFIRKRQMVSASLQ